MVCEAMFDNFGVRNPWLMPRDNICEHNKDWKGLSSKIVDTLELLSRHPEEVTQLSWRQDEDVVLYDAPCHLMHAQKIDANPRQMVNSLPGVKLVTLTESNWCCGSAGIYNLLQP